MNSKVAKEECRVRFRNTPAVAGHRDRLTMWSFQNQLPSDREAHAARLKVDFSFLIYHSDAAGCQGILEYKSGNLFPSICAAARRAGMLKSVLILLLQ